MKFLFGADVHGNKIQYEKIFSYAVKFGADVLCIAGDLTPKNPEQRTPRGQRDFLENYLLPSVSAIKGKIKVFLIMGNDDYKSNYDFLLSRQNCGYNLIDAVPAKVDGYCFVGYTYVPYTPFKWKDWEKRDLASDTVNDLRDDTRFDGFLSTEKGDFVPYNIKEHMADNSIEVDLYSKIKDIPADKLVLVSHAPPYNTGCDYTKLKNGTFTHVGSRAIARIIEKSQPLLTVHGHIHDSVNNTGIFPEKIGKTFCVSVSSNHIGDNPYVVFGDINNLSEMKRIRL